MTSVNIDALFANLELRDHLSADKKAALSALDWREKSYPAETEIVALHAKPGESCLLLDGLAARSMSVASGERQISAVHVPGDFVDLHGLFLKVMDHSVIALSQCRVAFVKHSALKRLMEEHPHLARLLSMMVAIDAAIQRNWILSLGRRQAASRLAHLLCELGTRLDIVGVADECRFPLPINQAELSDILGLSVVHTNRSLRHLREERLVTWKNRRISILDWDRLAKLAEFDPLYLNVVREPR